MSNPTMPNSLTLYKRLLGYTRSYWLALTVAIIGNLLYSAVDSSFVYLMKPVLNEGFNARNLYFISWVPFIIIGLFILRGLANFMGEYSMSYVARNIVMRFRQEIFRHILHLPARYYDNHTSGQLLSTLLYNVEQVANASTDALTTTVQSGALVIGLIVVMFTASWQLSLLYMLIVPLVAVAVKLSSRRIRRVSKGIQNSMVDVTTVAEEGIEGYRVIRIFNGAEYESNKFDKVTLVNRRREMKIVITKVITESSVQLMAASSIAITIYLAMSPNSMMLTAGAFASLIGAMLALLKPLKNMTNVNATIQKGLVGAQSVFALLDEPAEIDTGTTPLLKAKGNMLFKDINFSYRGEDQITLKNINFNVAAGQVIALVGRSGAGKSTLVSLIPRFYELQQGNILLDGVDIRDYRLRDLRSQIALVSQNVTLFNDTIARNIAYGCAEEVSEEQIIQAAEAAHAMSFIRELPQNLNTLIGENGILLSGGQRQRIAIARAILKNAPILILDEATSALDTESERHIQSALEMLMRQRTTFVIAHRLSTIENADKILVMDQGAIVEVGTHRELLALNGDYARLHAMQFKEKAA